jgi:hypothetical protein
LFKKMIFFTHAILLVSAIGAQAGPILPSAPGFASQLNKREIHIQKRSPGQDMFDSVVHTVKRSLSEIENPEDGNLGGHLIKRMITHLATRNEHNLGSALVDDLASIVKRSDELSTVINSLAEYSGDISKDGKQVVNALFENGVPKILQIVLEILKESDIISDIMAIVSKVTKAVVQRVFNLGKEKPTVGSKAESPSSPATPKPETPSEKPDTAATPQTSSKAPASEPAMEAKEPAGENAVSEETDVDA